MFRYVAWMQAPRNSIVHQPRLQATGLRALKISGRWLGLLGSCLLFNACMMVGPNYKEPVKLAATHWKKQSTMVKEAPVHDTQWWTVFHDPNLTALIQQGYQHNLSLQSAGVRVLQARAQLAQVVGALYPQQQALVGNLTFNRIGGSSLQDVLPTYFATALLGVSANWEIDFWGKYRRAILSNDAAFLAAYAAYDNALVNFTADLATTYINIRTTEVLIQVTKKNITVQAEGLKIAKARYSAGETSLLDVEQAQTELFQTESILPKYISELQRQKDALAVLLSLPPDGIEAFLQKKYGIPKAPFSVAVGIPRETLAQRPDIYQARMEAITQSEAIGATEANLYPSFALAGNFALAANTINGNSLSNIFNLQNATYTWGPTFNWPVLNYGQITNQVRAQDAAFQQASLNYQSLVLKAQQEVQDSITQFIETRKSEHKLIIANQSAIKATQLALIRYQEGESDYTPVLDAERQQLRVQTSLTQTQGESPKALVALYRALGGGWQIRGCNDIVPEYIKREMAQRTNWGNLLKQQNHQPPTTQKDRFKERYLPNW